jgi:glutamate-1-semialdehyde 2,1-aminomutase
MHLLILVAVRAAATLTATYNNLDQVRQIFEANKGEIAGVILEPVVGNSGFIPPTQEFLEVRQNRSGIVILW